MKQLFLFLSLVLAFNLPAQQRRRSTGLNPLLTPNITVNAGEDQTLPGPVAIATLAAVTSSTSGTNGVVTEWKYIQGPASAQLAQFFGQTNLAIFTEAGTYTIRVRSTLGGYYNEDHVALFVTNQDVTNFVPQITIIAPANGSTFTAPIDLLLIAAAEDKDGTIAKVVWYDGNTAIWTNTAPPYRFTLTNAEAISHVFAASVEDNRGATNLSTSVSVNVREANQSQNPPIVSIIIPTNNAVFVAPASFVFTASAIDLDGTIQTVTFQDNGNTLAVLTPGDLDPGGQDPSEPAPYGVLINPNVGIHQLKVIAVDDGGFQSSAVATFTVNPTANTIPTVALTSPSNGDSFAAPATIGLSATASDSDGTVSQVRFFQNGTLFVVDTAAPYTATATNLAAGTYQFWVQAVDNLGGVGTSSTNTVTVNPPAGTPPTITLTSPAGGSSFTAGNPITLSATATDDVAVTNVAWYAGSTFITNKTTPPYTQLWTPAANAYSITAVAWDNLGLSATSSPPASIMVNPPIPPFVQITSPTNNSVFIAGSNIPLAANASDSDGTITKVDFSQFQPDVFITSDSSLPYTGTWTNAPAGSFSLVAKATDNSGLTTVSPAIHVTITSPGGNLVVDAGPSQIATLSPYKAYFDAEYLVQSNAFNVMAASGQGTQYVSMQVVMDATLAAYDGSKETNYLNRALLWAETMISKAILVDTGGRKNWLGTYASPYSPTAMATQLEEFSGAAAMSRCARIIMSDDNLRSVYGARAQNVYNFVRDEVVNKNLITRGLYPEYVNFSRTITSATSDKPFVLFRLLMDLRTMSVVLGNNDNASYLWPQKTVELAEGIKDYNGQEARFIAWQMPGATVWSHGKTWQTYTDIDTDSANRLPTAVIEGFELGQTFTSSHISGLSDLLTKVMWDQSTTSPLVDNFIDGSNGSYNSSTGVRAANANGLTYDGWFGLAAYNTNSLNFAKFVATAVKNGAVNATLLAHNTAIGRTAMGGNLMRAVAMTGTRPYATLLGQVTGSGATGTNWTHVSGPGTFTIVNSGVPQPVVLFGTNAVGSHTFRLTITSAGPVISDDVVVTVAAAPAFGSGTPTPIPPTPTNNVFVDRFIFYRTGNPGLTTAAATARLTNIMARGAAAGYNGIVLEEPNLKALTPPSAALANLNAVWSLGNALGMVVIPYTFTPAEANNTAPLELREAFPVGDTKFVRNGTTASAVGDPAPIMLNGGFESFTGNQPATWVVDLPGTVTFIDTTNHQSGSASIRLHNPSASPNKGRVSQDFAVVPFRAYVCEVYVKTLNFSSPKSVKFYITGNNNQRDLFKHRDVPMGSASVLGTQDWGRYECNFNSLENSSIKLWLMAVPSSGTTTGDVWFDTASIREVGLYPNAFVRRTSTPITVTGYSGTPTYTENTDYTVSSGFLTIPTGSTIPAGGSLKVDWFQLAKVESTLVPGVQHPEFFNVITTNWGLIKTRFSPAAVMISYNEMRVVNWDYVYSKTNSGLYLSNLVFKTEGIINAATPSARKYIWNDLWDPYHNATVQQMMNKGTMHPAWNGVSTNITVMTWQSLDKVNSLKFWGGLDPNAEFKIPPHRIMIASYESTNTCQGWLDSLVVVEGQGVRNVRGIMYTTWVTGSDGLPGNYAPLEGMASTCKSAGRWATGPSVP